MRFCAYKTVMYIGDY